jgi:ribonucleotide reductase beta subunit family protein with ferritin-like domain
MRSSAGALRILILKRKSKSFLDKYDGKNEMERKIASVMLESFLFYSGFLLANVPVIKI